MMMTMMMVAYALVENVVLLAVVLRSPHIKLFRIRLQLLAADGS